MSDNSKDLYSILPFGKPAPRPAPPSSRSADMSKFAVLHREPDGFVLEHPLAWCDLRVHDPRLLVLLDGPRQEDWGLPTDVASQFIDDLHRGGFLATGDEERGFDTRSWSAPDLWFHRRSTLGERNVTWDHFGPTKWAKSRYTQPPAQVGLPR